VTAYYNEIDPKAAAWLRELIKQGHIAPGDVDETGIRDVDPARLGRYTQCHFFAGIGGWSLALRLAGWPDSRPVWTGSCPCQPFSAAGRRAGTADERHLWPHWHHLISQCQPAVVFGEQVASKDGLGWLDIVQADLEATGYAVAAQDICAAGVGAPHIRQRLWFVGLADAADEGFQIGRRGQGEQPGSVEQSERLRADERLADADEGERGRVADGEGRQHDWEAGGRQQGDREPERGGSGVGMADAGCSQRKTDGLSGRVQSQDNSTWWDIPNGGLVGCKQGYRDTCRQSTERTRSLDCFWQDADWLFCRDGKWRPVEPGTFPLAHGIPARVVRLRGYGNAIVPQAAAQFVKAFVAAANY
jgi:DNA (cytosine-5)-methyltransferase 1